MGWLLSRLVAVVIAVTGLAGCAGPVPAAPAASPQSRGQSSAGESRTLVLITRQETPSVSGTALVPGNFTPPGTSYYPELDRAITKYPFDTRRSGQLMQEAGFQKGPDGFFAGPEGKLVFEYRVITSAQIDAERLVLADGWRRAGFAFDQANFSPVENTQGELSNAFRCLWTTSGAGGENWINGPITANIPTAETTWLGSNRGGWSNPAFDRIVAAFNNTLIRSERDQLIVQSAQMVTDQLPVLPLFFNPAAWAWPASVRGVRIEAPTTEPTWNIYEWELK